MIKCFGISLNLVCQCCSLLFYFLLIPLNLLTLCFTHLETLIISLLSISQLLNVDLPTHAAPNLLLLCLVLWYWNQPLPNSTFNFQTILIPFHDHPETWSLWRKCIHMGTLITWLATFPRVRSNSSNNALTQKNFLDILWKCHPFICFTQKEIRK